MRGHETGFPRLRGGESWFEEGAERGISLFCYEHQETHGGMGSVLGTVLFDLLFQGGAGWRGSSRAPRSPRQPVWILELPMFRTSHFFSFWTATFGHPAARLPSSISSLISTHCRQTRTVSLGCKPQNHGQPSGHLNVSHHLDTGSITNPPALGMQQGT